MNRKAAVILLAGAPGSGKTWVAEYMAEARRRTGTSVEFLSFQQARIQSAVATLSVRKQLPVSGEVTFATLATFPLSESVKDFLEVIDKNVRKDGPAVFAQWIMLWIRLRHQDGCQLFIIPDLEYAEDVAFFLTAENEFNLRFVHVVAASRSTLYQKEKKKRTRLLDALPKNVELNELDERVARRKLTNAVVTSEFPGLFHRLDNSVDGPEHVKAFQRKIFFDAGLRVEPPFPWTILWVVAIALTGIYFAFYY
jgi:hypothetical protein